MQRVRPAQVMCDRCQRRFAPALIEEPCRDGGAELRFSCPRCGRLYRVAAITAVGLDLRRRLAQMARMGQSRNPQYAEMLRRYRAEVRGLAGADALDAALVP